MFTSSILNKNIKKIYDTYINRLKQFEKNASKKIATLKS